MLSIYCCCHQEASILIISAQFTRARSPPLPSFQRELLLKHFGSSDGLVPVLRRVEAKFRNPANGTIMSTASTTPESLARLDAELSSKGRSVIGITVEIYDESGAHTLSATFDWFIQRQKNSDQA